MNETLRVISWNIQWGRGADGRVDLARTVDALHALGGAQGAALICLQEVACCFPGLPGGAEEDEVALLRAAFPGYQAVFGAGVDVPGSAGGRTRFGNLLLSRLPLGQVYRHLLPAPADGGLPSMQRVCVEAVVEAPWGPLRVLTTHLEYYSARQRMAQVQALCALQESVVDSARVAAAPRVKEGNASFAPWPRPPAALLCGDFNCEPGSAEHAVLRAGPHWHDAWVACHGDLPHAPTVGLHGAEWPQRAYCCDYFCVTGELLPRLADVAVDGGTAASDHQPVTLDLFSAPGA